MKKILIKISAAVLAICILCHTGNPVKWVDARAKAADYLAENYGKGYTFRCKYMMFGHIKGYKCTVKNPDFPERLFYIYILDNGEILY